MTQVFNLSLAGYLAALLLAIANLQTQDRRRFATATTMVLGVAAIVQTLYFVLRWLAAGRAPFSNMFETLTLFAWTIVVVYLSLQRHWKLPVLAAGTALLAVLTLAYASTFETKISPLMPALRSNWLTFHVITCFLGYGATAVAFLSSSGFIISSYSGRSKKETLEALEAATDKSIPFGFLFLTIGIITGAVWANSAWGTYWSWDPKETWSLITWFIYAIYLHCRFMRGWRGRVAAWISTIGFTSVLFTYFGVNYVLSGLHSYAN